MSSVSPPNKSDNNRISVDSKVEQPGRDTEGTVDRLNEAPQWFRSLRLSIEADGFFFTEAYIAGQKNALDRVERFLVLRDGQPG